MPPRLKLPSPMKGGHDFSQVPQVAIERSKLDRSRGYKTTFSAGYLVPIRVDEILPGDTVNVSLTALVRLNTPIKPIMDNLWVDVFYFFVPNRLLWSNWQKFNGEQLNPGDSTSYTIPVMVTPVGGYAIGSVQDYMGLPTGVANTGGATWPLGTGANTGVSALPVRGFYMIYNEWFRDENLCTRITVPTGDGPDTWGATVPPKRGKRHDYFTSALPWPQKGTAVSIPLGSSATVKTNATALLSGAQEAMQILSVGGGTPTGDRALTTRSGPPTRANVSTVATTNGGASTDFYPTNLFADLTNATAATINSLRQAFQIQKMLERDARGGTRYVEILKAHFGVTSPDARLQRPEYLGGGTVPINVAPIAQSTQAASPTFKDGLANLGGVGAGIAHGIGFTKSFVEHGYLYCIINARADLTYSQGIEKFWLRSTRFDFYWPALAHIGEQTIINAEIWTQDNLANNLGVFGYQERYAEYRYGKSLLTGLFRPDAAGTLAVYHVSEDFASLPALNQTFIEDQTSTILDRVVAVTTEPDFYIDAWFKEVWARPMPVFGVPGMIDHF